VHYREVLVKEKIKAFRINESVLEAFRIILHDTYTMTSSGARAMHGFGAMCLLRRSRCMFLAPQSAALRCPWVRALLVPVVRVPSCARGPPYVFFFTAHVQQICTTVRYCSTVRKKGGHEPRTKFHLIERMTPYTIDRSMYRVLYYCSKYDTSCHDGT